MSDMNLPTVTVRMAKTDGGPTWGVYEHHTDPALVKPGTYVMVLVDAISEVCWCEVHLSPLSVRTLDGEDLCHAADLSDFVPNEGCAFVWNWLVKAEE